MISRIRLDANARLCHAVQKHPLIYDRSHKSYNSREAYDLTWSEIAKACEESVLSCKNRWRHIRYAFSRTLKESPNKSKGSRIKEYYLHNDLDFLLPHMNATSEPFRFRQADVETAGRTNKRRSTTTSDNITKVKTNVKTETGSDVEENEGNHEKIITAGKNDEEDLREEKNNNGNGMKDEDNKNTNEIKPIKRSLSSRSKSEGRSKEDIEEKADKDSESVKSEGRSKAEAKEKIGKDSESVIKGEGKSGEENTEKKKKDGENVKSDGNKFNEIRTKRRSQSVRNKNEGNTENTEEEKAAETKTDKTHQTPKKKMGAFYISPKNDATLTFFIKKTTVNNETKDATSSETGAANQNNEENGDKMETQEKSTNEDSKAKETADSDETEEIALNQMGGRSMRLKRACKRNLAKTMIDELQTSEKEPEVKRVRRSAERLKSIAKSAQELIKSMEVAKQETKSVKLKESNVLRKKSKSFNSTQSDEVEIALQSPIKIAANSTPKMPMPPQIPMNLSPVAEAVPAVPTKVSPNEQLTLNTLNENTLTTALTLEPKKVEVVAVSVNQSVQCDLLKAETDDDFFSTLRPYLLDMNARQKLHFKKKIFESLMEVFDSGADFPAAKKLKMNDDEAIAIAPSAAIIPPQLNATVSGEELSLVRELVAIVQAAKQTPELIANNSNNNENSSNSSAPDSLLAADEEKRSLLSPAIITPISKPPPLLRVTPTNVTQFCTSVMSADLPSYTPPRVSTIQQISVTPKPRTTATTTTSLTPAQALASLQQRRVIRKLVKVNDVEQTSFNNSTSTSCSIVTNSDGSQRRIYRIMPKNVVTNTTTGVNTFVVPRTTDVVATINAARHKLVTQTTVSSSNTSPTTTVAQSFQQVWVQGSSAATTKTSSNNIIQPRGDVGAATKTTITKNQNNYRQLVIPAGSNTTITSTTATKTPQTTTTSTLNIRPVVRTTTCTPSSIASAASTATSSTNTTVLSKRILPAKGGRSLVRRYSVCGSLPNLTIDQQSDPLHILTTTANEKVSSSVPKITIVGRGLADNQNNNELFKFPTLRSLNTTTTTAAATTTTTFSSRGKLLVSASATGSTTSARTTPVSVGCKKLLRNDENFAKAQSTFQSHQSTAFSSHATSSQSPKYTNMRPYATISSLLADTDDKRTDAEQRLSSDAETMSNEEFESVDFSGIIGSDNFEVLTIKNEPIDFD